MDIFKPTKGVVALSLEAPEGCVFVLLGKYSPDHIMDIQCVTREEADRLGYQYETPSGIRCKEPPLQSDPAE